MVRSRKRAASSVEKTRRSAVEYRSISGTALTACETASAAIAALGPVLLGLVNSHSLQRPRRKMRPQARPESQREVFRGRDLSVQPDNVGVEVAVVDVLNDLGHHQVRE